MISDLLIFLGRAWPTAIAGSHRRLWIGIARALAVLALALAWTPSVLADPVDIRPFTDVTEAALKPQAYQSFTRRNGLALFDYNQDGWLDIFLTSVKGRPSFLYRNAGDGTFTDVAAQVGLQKIQGNGRGVAAADLNNDGWPDLYVGNGGTIGDGLDFRSAGDQGNINRLFLNVPGPDGQRVFRDVTEIAGVGDPRSASTIAVADVNSDGWLDIYVANLGDEDLREFEAVDPTGHHNAHRNTFYLNKGPNTEGVPVFADVTLAAGVAGPPEKNRDINGNALLTFAPNLKDAQGNPVGDNPGNQTHAALFTDIDGDGDQDLFTGDDFGTLTLYRNDGDTDGDSVPSFTDISRLVGINQVGNWMGFATADYDGDGDLDFFVTNMGAQVVTSGGFDSFDLQRFRWGNRMLALLRNDGTRTLPGAGTIPVLPNAASATLVQPSAAMPPRALDARNVQALHEPVQGLEAYEFGFGATFFDLENDGAPDLYWVGDTGGIGADTRGIARLFHNPGRLLRNNGDGSFADVTIEAHALTIRNFPWEQVGRPGFDPLQFVVEHHLANTALAAGDLNNDGFVDVVALTEGRSDRPGPLFILMNGNRGNDWVKVRTVGTKSNRDGIGAKVTLTVDSGDGPVFKRQLKQVTAGSSYLATEAKELVFGLGRGARDLTLQVEWPSGRVDVYRNVERNQVFVAVEGQGRSDR